MTARQNQMISTVKNFTAEIEKQLNAQWIDFEEFLKHLN